MYLTARYKYVLIYLKKYRVSKTVLFICFLRIRTAEIKINAFYRIFGEEFFKILRFTHKKFQVRQIFLYRKLHSADYYVSCHLHRNKINIRVTPCRFNRKAALSAAYLKMNRIIIAEYLPHIKRSLLCFTSLLCGIIHKPAEIHVAASVKTFIKVFFSSHSHKCYRPYLVADSIT